MFLWDSLELALDNCTILTSHKSKPAKVAILEVNIPKSWTRSDDGYDPGEAGHGHSFRVRRRISPRRIKQAIFSGSERTHEKKESY